MKADQEVTAGRPFKTEQAAYSMPCCEGDDRTADDDDLIIIKCRKVEKTYQLMQNIYNRIS